MPPSVPFTPPGIPISDVGAAASALTEHKSQLWVQGLPATAFEKPHPMSCTWDASTAHGTASWVCLLYTSSIEFNTTEDILTGAIELISAKQVVEPGDIIVLTAGIPSPNIKRSKEGVSNMMRIAVID